MAGEAPSAGRGVSGQGATAANGERGTPGQEKVPNRAGAAGAASGETRAPAAAGGAGTTGAAEAPGEAGMARAAGAAEAAGATCAAGVVSAASPRRCGLPLATAPTRSALRGDAEGPADEAPADEAAASLPTASGGSVQTSSPPVAKAAVTAVAAAEK